VANLGGQKFTRQAQASFCRRNVLPDPGGPAPAGGCVRPSDHAADPGAPADGAPTPQELSGQATRKIDVPVHLDAQDTLDRYVAELFIALADDQAATPQVGARTRGGQMHDLRFWRSSHHSAGDR